MADISVRLKEETILQKTGQSWKDWVSLLKGFAVARRGHRESARHLQEAHGLSPWWAQCLTIRFELEFGLREPLQRHNRRFSVVVQRTVACGLKKAWDAWSKSEILSQWFTSRAQQEFNVGGRYSNANKDAGLFLKIVKNKLIRFTWEQPKHRPGSIVDVAFAAKDDGRVVIRLTHSKLQTKADADDLKRGWSWALDSFKSCLEPGRKITWDEWSGAS